MKRWTPMQRVRWQLLCLWLRVVVRVRVILCMLLGHQWASERDLRGSGARMIGPPGSEVCPACFQWRGKLAGEEQVRRELRLGVLLTASAGTVALIVGVLTGWVSDTEGLWAVGGALVGGLALETFRLGRRLWRERP